MNDLNQQTTQHVKESINRIREQGLTDSDSNDQLSWLEYIYDQNEQPIKRYINMERHFNQIIENKNEIALIMESRYNMTKEESI